MMCEFTCIYNVEVSANQQMNDGVAVVILKSRGPLKRRGFVNNLIRNCSTDEPRWAALMLTFK